MKNILFKYLFMVAGAIICTGAYGQKAWVDPSDPSEFNPEDTVTIYINMTNCERQQLVDFAGDVYLWTWSPDENKGPCVNGSWTDSEECMKMTRTANPNIYFYKLVPTVFYASNANTVYAKGFSFLAKADSGADLGNGEMKTEDLHVDVEKPGAPKVYTMPSVPKGYKGQTNMPDTLLIAPTDYITLFYNNRLEEVATLKSLADDTELHIFFKIKGSDGVEYLNSKPALLGSNLASTMRSRGDGLFTLTFQPEKIFASCGLGAAFTPPPAGVRPVELKIQVAKCSTSAPNPSAAGNGLAAGIFIWNIGKCN